MRHGRIVVAAGALTALGVLAAPQVVSAHIADVVKTCDHLEVSVGLFDDGVRTSVTIDGNTTVQSGNGHWVFAWSETQAHSYQVVVDAVNPVEDKTFTGEQPACTPPPDSTTSTTTTTSTTMGSDTTTIAPETTTKQAGMPTIDSSTPATPITQNLAVPTVRGSGGGRGPGSGGDSGMSASGALPRTGPNDTAPLVVAGVGALVGGSALVFVARRGARGRTSS
jgi:LPXTG-motif cell wall-anchored protein